MIFNGKALYKSSVLVTSKKDYSIMFQLKDKKKARDFYDRFDYSKKRLFFKRLLIRFCQHKDMYDLDIGSKLYHYRYCPDCDLAIHVDDEGPEARELRRSKLALDFEEREVSKLKTEINSLEMKLERRKKLLVEMELEVETKKREAGRERFLDDRSEPLEA